MNKYFIGILLGVTAIATFITGSIVVKDTTVKVDIPDIQMGAFATPDVFTPLRVHNTFMWGGKTLATTTGASIATTTLSSGDMVNYDYIDFTNAGAANIAYQLPATSTMGSILPDIGSTRKWLFHYASASLTFTLVAPTGIDLVAVSDAYDIIDAGEYMELTCTHIYYRGADNENIMCIVSELANSD